MEQELSFLRRKVNRLEGMIVNINDKIGLILEKFLNHRARQAVGIRDAMQIEEDLCLSLVTQLKSCIINSDTITNKRKNYSNSNSKKPAPNIAGPSGLKPAPAQAGRTTRSTSGKATAATATMAKTTRRSEPEEFQEPPPSSDRDPFASDSDGGESTHPNHSISIEVEPLFTPHVKKEPVDVDSEFVVESPEIMSQGQPTSDSDDEGEPAEGEEDTDPDFRPSASAKATAAGKPSLSNRPRRASLAKWVVKTKFGSKDEAQENLREKWCVAIKNMQKNGEYVTYYCREHGKRCKARYKLLYPWDSTEVVLYENGEPHEGGSTKILNIQLKQFINDLIVGGTTKPSQILDAIRQNGFTEPSKIMLNNFLARKRRLEEEKNRFGPLGPLSDEHKQALEEIYFGGVTKLEEIHQELTRRGFENVPKFRIYSYVSKLRRNRFGDLSFMRGPKKQAGAGRRGRRPKSTARLLGEEPPAVAAARGRGRPTTAEVERRLLLG